MFGKARRITVELPDSYGTYTVLDKLDVACETDGSLVIRCDAKTAARLAGRVVFGAVAETQEALKDKIADSWYAAGCPR